MCLSLTQHSAASLDFPPSPPPAFAAFEYSSPVYLPAASWLPWFGLSLCPLPHSSAAWLPQSNLLLCLLWQETPPVNCSVLSLHLNLDGIHWMEHTIITCIALIKTLLAFSPMDYIKKHILLKDLLIQVWTALKKCNSHDFLFHSTLHYIKTYYIRLILEHWTSSTPGNFMVVAVKACLWYCQFLNPLTLRRNNKVWKKL